MAFIDSMNPEWSGTLPASFLYDESGEQVEFWEGKITAKELDAKISYWLEKAEDSGTYAEGLNP